MPGNHTFNGRLDRREQIFELTVDDVDRATQNPEFDIRAAVEERGAFYRKLKWFFRLGKKREILKRFIRLLVGRDLKLNQPVSNRLDEVEPS